MKKYLAIIVGLLLLPLAIHATEFKEGKHYTVINEVATENPEVIEFFSYYCGHCFDFEPKVKAIQQGLGDDLQITKNHVNYLGKHMGPMLTQALATAQLLAVDKEVSSFIFNQLHTQKQPINGEADILTIFEKAGVKKAEAEAAFESFAAKGIASQMKRKTENYKVRGVPALIVNGKYQVKGGSVKTTAEYVELIKYLAKKQD